MKDPIVSINLVVMNGEKYIRECLKAVFSQTYENIEVTVWDNNSSDATPEIVEKEFPQTKLIRNDKNYGLGGGQNKCFEKCRGEYVVFHCVDVILDKDFVKKGIKTMGEEDRCGVAQAKILVYNSKLQKKTDIIDTTGFEIFRSRRIINRGHGEKDVGQYNKKEEIVSYEGACGFFRRKALEDSKIEGEILDEDFFWYGDDVDLGWRMRLLGWKSVYNPEMIAWHDRQTTKRLKKNIFDFIKIRKELPWKKRMLDWRNQRLSMVKNEFINHFLRDLPYFFKREILLVLYFIFFEPRTFFVGLVGFLKILPRMIRKRRIIISRIKVDARDIKMWFR